MEICIRSSFLVRGRIYMCFMRKKSFYHDAGGRLYVRIIRLTPAGPEAVGRNIKYMIFHSSRAKTAPWFLTFLKFTIMVKVKVIICQRFCKLTRLVRIAYCLCFRVWIVGHFKLNPGKSVYWLSLVISIPLCQTSCPMRTVHYSPSLVIHS